MDVQKVANEVVKWELMRIWDASEFDKRSAEYHSFMERIGVSECEYCGGNGSFDEDEVCLNCKGKFYVGNNEIIEAVTALRKTK